MKFNIYDQIIETGSYIFRNGYAVSKFEYDKCKTWFIDNQRFPNEKILGIIDHCIEDLKRLSKRDQVYVVGWSIIDHGRTLKIEVRIVYD